jgi:hypothetical protein
VAEDQCFLGLRSHRNELHVPWMVQEQCHVPM